MEIVCSIYRPSSLLGIGVYYDVHDSAQQDKVLGTLENDTIIAKEIPPGPRKIWASTEVKDETYIDAKPNKIECIKGSVGFGIIVGHLNYMLLIKRLARMILEKLLRAEVK